ncbi:cyclic dehypoxanthinyl futalosine synthase [Sporomusa acidovorans]|uniref:cyclic dehypoxanthinyl futalosine synthase n=1 Tax=Sporomusa acidovorans TaxID=112900 RepID=UPI000B81CC91|nr:cyclic dehypoxanthinyl futalosine synthase [Sporomusa acidovorans]
MDRTLAGNRLQDDDALALLTEGDLPALGQAADTIRQRKHPEPYATFIVDRNINYTNVCKSQCKFCAFYRAQEAEDAYVLATSELYQKIDETIAAGGTQIMLQGGLHPALQLEYFENMLRGIKARFPITIHSFSPAEIVHMAVQAGISIEATLRRLQLAGLDSLPGGGAEILDDAVRQRVSPLKITANEWLDVMETAQRLGMGTTATMVIGMRETYRQRINHFRAIRELQDRTGGFRAFIMWTFQPGNTELGGEKATAWDYLRTLAAARLYLDNISHLQGSWVTQGQSIGQLTLAFGADDLGSIMLEENVVRAAGTAYQMSIDKMTGLIRATGKIPAQRNTQYEILKTF